MVVVIVTITETIQLLLDVQDLIHPIAIYQIGSTTLPYISFSKDIDLLFVVSKSARSAWLQYIHYVKRNKITDIDVHICDINDTLGSHTYPYLLHYGILLYGEPVLNIDIFNPLVKEQVILHWFNHLPQINPLSKIIYHLYTLLFFWQHNDYILTPEEIETVNAAHNRQLDDNIRQDLYWKLWLLFWPEVRKLGLKTIDISMPDIRRYIQENFPETEW